MTLSCDRGYSPGPRRENCGQPAGTQTAVGILSFFATKLITSGGQGGALIADNADMAEAVRDYREFDCRRDRKARFNLQMTDLQASVGRVQLSRFPDFVRKRQRILSVYEEAGLPLLCNHERNVESVPYRAIIRSENAARILDHLRISGVKAIIPVEEWELLSDGDAFPNAQAFSRQLVSLPIYPGLKLKDAREIARKVRNLL
ncbi:MAG: DegT/DnrJ/EryC1/StrS family aminotransferase [Leptospiraceae bacterium]|nr:DegT/DnrJ/EryC1/StrS family aminotransferase [Leptospiraceae bacterium]